MNGHLNVRLSLLYINLCESTQYIQNVKMTYLLTAVGLTPFGSSTVHICTKTVHSTAVQYTSAQKQYTVQQYSTHLHKNSTQYCSTVHICTKTVHSTAVQYTLARTHKQYIHGAAQLTTLFGRLSGIRTQSGQTKFNIKSTTPEE